MTKTKDPRDTWRRFVQEFSHLAEEFGFGERHKYDFYRRFSNRIYILELSRIPANKMARHGPIDNIPFFFRCGVYWNDFPTLYSFKLKIIKNGQLAPTGDCCHFYFDCGTTSIVRQFLFKREKFDNWRIQPNGSNIHCLIDQLRCALTNRCATFFGVADNLQNVARYIDTNNGGLFDLEAVSEGRVYGTTLPSLNPQQHALGGLVYSRVGRIEEARHHLNGTLERVRLMSNTTPWLTREQREDLENFARAIAAELAKIDEQKDTPLV